MIRAWTCPARLCALFATLALVVLSLGIATPAAAVTPGTDRGNSEQAHQDNADRKSESTSATEASTTTAGGGDDAANNSGRADSPDSTKAGSSSKSTKSADSSKSTKSNRGSAKSDSAKTGGPSKAASHTKIGTGGTSGVTTQEQPVSNADLNSGGANGQCSDAEPDAGVYCSTRDGAASGNGQGVGKATGKPCAGCVGKADNKNPPGQMPGPQDLNNGYECDNNNGVGKGKLSSKDGATSPGNPAHTGCVSPPTVSEECPPGSTAPECVEEDDCPPGSQAPECVEDEECPPGSQAPECVDDEGGPPPVIGGVQDFANPRPPTVAGVDQFAGPPPAVLPSTGAGSAAGWLTTLGVGLLLMGAALIGLRRHGLVTARR